MVLKDRKSTDVQRGEGKDGSPSHHNKQLLDKRFDTSKPQFRKPKPKDTKVELDDRFQSVLTDPKFHLLEASVDKYGRKISKKKQLAVKKQGEKEFGEVYSIKDRVDETERTRLQFHDDRFADAEETVKMTSATSISIREADKKGNGDSTSRIAYLNALARGEVELSSSDDDDHDDSNEESDDDSNEYDAHGLDILSKEKPGVLDPSFVDEDAIITGAVDYTTIPSPYIAVMNADWSHFRAVDIFAIISSFVPAGAVKHVSVFPSNFGLERLKKEELFGPVDVWKNDEDSKDNASDSESVDNASPSESDGNEKEVANEIEISDEINADFDPEKLRLYEASRLKYYFAIVEFVSPQYADIAYNEVDGMEFEHSSAALDVRIIPVDEIDNIVENRKVRDKASAVPSNYNPPDFVVNALQQSTVECTWDVGDRNRETLLTKYNLSGQTWGQISEADDIKAYLASDHSSDEEQSVKVNKKSVRLRSMLGLDSDDDNNDEKSDGNESEDDASDNSSHISNSGKYTMEATFVPGKLNMTNENDTEKQDRELTPWEKYQEKRQQKKRERRAAARERRKQVNEDRKKGKSRTREVRSTDFLISENDSNVDAVFNPPTNHDNDGCTSKDTMENEHPDKLDFDIRIVQRLEKNKGKKLTGARKRKEERFTENFVNTDFQIDTTDDRFKAVLEGNDERYGIDRTDPNFKETPAMKKILEEQTRHRSKQRKLSSNDTNPKPSAINDDTVNALVTRIKQKVHR